jgi:hypothetical protein
MAVVVWWLVSCSRGFRVRGSGDRGQNTAMAVGVGNSLRLGGVICLFCHFYHGRNALFCELSVVRGPSGVWWPGELVAVCSRNLGNGNLFVELVSLVCLEVPCFPGLLKVGVGTNSVELCALADAFGRAGAQFCALLTLVLATDGRG